MPWPKPFSYERVLVSIQSFYATLKCSQYQVGSPYKIDQTQIIVRVIQPLKTLNALTIENLKTIRKLNTLCMNVSQNN